MVKINAQLETGKVLQMEPTIEGIQRCFYMDIQRFEKNSTKANTT